MRTPHSRARDPRKLAKATRVVKTALAIEDPAVFAEVAPIFRRALTRITREATSRGMTVEDYIASVTAPSTADRDTDPL